MQLVDSVYDLVALLPKDERFELSSQLRRAAVSIPSNIAEGHGRRHRRAFTNNLSIARGSAMEVETLLKIVRSRRLADLRTTSRSLELVDEVARMLASLIIRLEARERQAPARHSPLVTRH